MTQILQNLKAGCIPKTTSLNIKKGQKFSNEGLRDYSQFFFFKIFFIVLANNASFLQFLNNSNAVC